jgi:oligopeptide/dipeptide ABC transporter ATP-binding protein
MTNVLSVKDLRSQFKMRTANVVAVDGVSFHIDEGECVGLVGESGCGKTTIGTSIMRLLPSNGEILGGSIEIQGRDIVSLSEQEMQSVRGNLVAFIPQDPMTSLNPTMPIGKQIAEGYIHHRKCSEEEGRQRALEVLRLVDMPRPEERLAQFPHELSGGLRQRVIIAMALVNEPKLLIADEPTTALDVTIQAQILDLIDRLRRELKMAVLLITHDMGVIADRTDRVVVMYAGKKAEMASTAELFADMRHPYTQALLNAVPKIEESGYRLLSIPGLPPDLSKPITGCRFASRCPYVTDTCRATEPTITSIEGAAHEFACFNPTNGQSTNVIVRETAHEVAITTSEPLVEIRNLVKKYPIRSSNIFRRSVGAVNAISDISLLIRKGETYGLVGESGCGKTTTGKVLVGLEPATSGAILYKGNEVSSLRGSQRNESRRNIQMMFQDPYSSLNPRQPVGSILEEPLVIQKTGTSKERKDRVLELLAQVGLPSAALQRYPHEFSGGQRQRIGLARAMALKPELLIADEPVSALDVSIQAQILNLMKDLRQELGLSMLMISHDLGVIRYMADTVGVMYLGKLVETGPSESIYRNPVHPYTRGLLDSVPRASMLRGEGESLTIQGELPSAVNPPSGCRFRTRCPKVQDICSQEEPAMAMYGPDHFAACHFPLRTPVQLTSHAG